jgi:hypothetical protein
MSKQFSSQSNRQSSSASNKDFTSNNNSGSISINDNTEPKSKTNNTYRKKKTRLFIKENMDNMNTNKTSKKSKTKYSTMSNIKSNSKNTKHYENNDPIIKLPDRRLYSILILAIIGAVLFNIGVFMANSQSLPITGAIYNSMPIGMIIALFINKDQLDNFLFGNLIARGINFFLIGPTFLLYYYEYISSFQYIVLNMILWAIAIIISQYLKK